MSLRNLIAADVSRVFMQTREFAESITYTVDGNDTPLVAVVFDEQQTEDAGDTGREQEQWRDVTISRDPDSESGGVASPRLDAVLSIGDVKYAVESIPYQDDTVATLRVVRVESIEKSRPGYRRGGYRP